MSTTTGPTQPASSEQEKENVSSYVNSSRFPKASSPIQMVLFAVTLPLCLSLALIRLFLGLQALIILCVMPKRLKLRRYFLRLVLMLIGVFLHVEKPPKKSFKPAVIVSNHVSVLDRLLVECCTPCYTLSVRDIPLLVRLVIGSLDMTPRHEAPPPTAVAKTHLDNSDVPILTLPEQIMTNGGGLLKFASWPFSISPDVQIACVEVKRLHFLRPNLSHVFASSTSDFFWCLFSPAHFATIRFLSVGEDWKDRNPEQKASFTQSLISHELEIPALKLTCHDVSEHKKSLVKEQVVDLDSLVRQVVEVLPNIPESEIRADLMRTRDTTQTIYNLVKTAPRTVPNKSLLKNTATSAAGSTGKASGSVFKNPVARANMLELKKAELIASGRARYIEKHGLTNIDS